MEDRQCQSVWLLVSDVCEGLRTSVAYNPQTIPLSELERVFKIYVSEQGAIQ